MTRFFDPGNTNNLAKHQVSNSLSDHQEEPPEGEMKLSRTFYYFISLVINCCC